MKKCTVLIAFLVTCATAATVATAATPPKAVTIGIHLFFNEKEFVDTMTLQTSENGALVGHMSVPNDFEGPLLNLASDGEKISFDLLVPKNATRPTDLVFHYNGQYFDAAKKTLTGFVTLKDDTHFVAAFVGFSRD